MAPPSTAEVVVASLLYFFLCTTSNPPFFVVEATWCVVRSEASEQAMLTGLNFACAAGADCAPLLSSGLCYLPNTLPAHASYAYNSYYQRRGGDPASCYFSGTATFAKTDPSYGSCVYPSSPSTAGGLIPPGRATSVPGTTPVISATPPPPATTTTVPLYSGLTPGMGSAVPDSPKPNASPDLSTKAILFLVYSSILSTFIFQIM